VFKARKGDFYIPSGFNIDQLSVPDLTRINEANCTERPEAPADGPPGRSDNQKCTNLNAIPADSKSCAACPGSSSYRAVSSLDSYLSEKSRLPGVEKVDKFF